MKKTMLTVHEVAELTGVTVRALHHYDEIGLLKPDEVTDAGYRLYGETALARLQQVLFFRELELPLAEIAAVLNDAHFDSETALRRHRELLLLKRQRLDGLIALTENILKGDNTMSFKEFEQTELERGRAQYAAEVKERWGQTDAYAESEKKTAAYGKDDWQQANAEMDALCQRFAALRASDPAGPEAQALVDEWQAYISRRFYQCTDEILAGLGQMYSADERFRANLDKHGEGTAAFMTAAIAGRNRGSIE